MGAEKIFADIIAMKKRASELIAQSRGIEISEESKAPQSTYAELLEKKVSEATSGIPTFNESELDALITDANGNKYKIAVIAAKLGGEAGKYVMDELLSKYCTNPFERAYYSLIVRELTSDPELQKYATEMRSQNLPQSIAKIDSMHVHPIFFNNYFTR
ncbi:MAG: hypothetical protein QW063_02255 [Candidatus Nanoarchaeia archaeon]